MVVVGGIARAGEAVFDTAPVVEGTVRCGGVFSVTAVLATDARCCMLAL